MIAHAAERGILVAVFFAISCILGLVAALNIPVQMIPDLDVRTVTVRTGWPGATPQDIEKEILIEQERYLRSVPNLKRMMSYSTMGRATIELEFPFGVDVNDALIRVNNALSQVPGYPENVDQPRLSSSSFSSNAFMYFVLKPLPGNPLKLDMDLLNDFAEDYVRPRMETVPGVSDVNVYGGAARQIQIKIDAAKLAQRGIRLTAVRDAIRERNKDASAGDIESGKSRYLLRVLGRFEQIDEIGNIELKRVGDAVVKIKDIAKISLDHFETSRKSYFDSERTIGLSVRRESGSNVIDIKQTMLPLVDELNQQFLRQNGLELLLTSDDVKYVTSSLKNVWSNLLLGALLATAILYLFLRSGKATLIGVIGIPICTIAAFGALTLFGRTINVISLAGVAFAIGMTVDNTIVVLESIVQAHKKGVSKLQAAKEGVIEVWPAVLASTMTTILVFAPILFVEQEAGQLYSDIAIAISGAIIASMLVAIFIVPVASANIGKASGLHENEQMPLSKHWLKMADYLTSSIQKSRAAVVVFTLVILGLAYSFLPAAEYLPEGEEPKAFSIMIAPPSHSLSEMESIATELNDYFAQFVKTSPENYLAGKTDMPPLEYYSLSVQVGRIRVISAPVDPDNIHQMMEAITKKFKSYPGMRAFSSRGSIISSNDGGTRAVAVDLSGNDLITLYQAAEAVYQQAKLVFDNPQINSQPSSLTLSQPLIEIRPRWQRLSELEIRPNEFRFAVAAMSDGAFVDEFILGDDKVDMFLFSDAGNQQTIEQLSRAPFVTASGQVLPLNSIADLVESKNSDNLRRIDGKRTVTVYIIPPRNLALETAEAMVRNELLPELWRKGEISQGIKVSISGAADQLEATKNALSGNFIIAIVLCYLLLVAIFNHWHYPAFILATVPLGMAGGLLGLILINGVNQGIALFGIQPFYQPFDMITMLGFLILLGTVVNNPILIVDQTRRNIENLGLTVKEAVMAALDKRLMPILMSTFTTIFGLAPLVLIPGEGTELYRGVGIIVLSGILFSAFLTLSFLPALLVSVLKDKRVS